MAECSEVLIYIRCGGVLVFGWVWCAHSVRCGGGRPTLTSDFDKFLMRDSVVCEDGGI